MILIFWGLAYLFMGWITLVFYFSYFEPAPKARFEMSDQDWGALSLMSLGWPIALTVMFAICSVELAVKLGFKFRKKD